MNNHNLYNTQKGAATLLVSMVLLVSITLVVFFTAQTVIMEQRVVANESRSVDSFNAAYSGAEYMVEYYANNRVTGMNASGYIIPAGYTSISAGSEWVYLSGSSGPHFRVRFADPSDPSPSPLVSPSTALTRFAVIAEGRSEDFSAIKTVSLAVQGTPALADPPDNPLTSKGKVDVGGNAKVYNPTGSLTIWSGKTYGYDSNATINTYIKHPTAADAIIESSNKGNKGLDVIDNDTNLGTLTQEEFFRNFFGMTPAAYKASVASQPILTSYDTLDGQKGKVIWVTPASGEKLSATPTIGTTDEPVILVVEGDLDTKGGPTIYGLLFVLGNYISGSGSMEIHGAAIINGEFSTSNGGSGGAGGSMEVHYDEGVLSNTRAIGRGVGMPGTWKDW